ncbi:MAG: Crp/Fnr family transcriptional regulator [Cytophagales bacterium]|nr:Crp/Fnr family transcriptional regulator [Cytophagales bacterium]
MHKISAYYQQYKPLSIASQDALDALSKTVAFPKGYLIHRQGQVCREVFLLEKGVARIFYYRDGNDITNQFFCEGEAIAAMESLYSGKPSYYNIELLEDCQLVKVNYREVEKLYAQYHDLESCGRVLAIHCYLEENERNRSFQMLTAKERYLNLLKTQPGILQRVNLGHIASYIGITQVQLSRIRAEIMG